MYDTSMLLYFFICYIFVFNSIFIMYFYYAPTFSYFFDNVTYVYMF